MVNKRNNIALLCIGSYCNIKSKYCQIHIQEFLEATVSKLLEKICSTVEACFVHVASSVPYFLHIIYFITMYTL
jgi:hypothetical protein